MERLIIHYSRLSDNFPVVDSVQWTVVDFSVKLQVAIVKIAKMLTIFVFYSNLCVSHLGILLSFLLPLRCAPCL